MSVLLWALLGFPAGAILNHLADRLPQHKGLNCRPACPYCAAPYLPQQWLALLGALTGQGRCRHCGAPLPARRWLFEAGVVLLYALLAWRYGISGRVAVATLHASALALICITDLETRVVPDVVVLPGSAFALLLAAPAGLGYLGWTLLGGALGFGLFALLAAVYPGAMGMGDVKLAGYIGLIAGYPRILPCLLIAALAGGIGAAVLLLSGRGHRRSYMPYAPYLALAGIVALFLL